jgi:predicted nucleotidyltransferase
MSSWTEGVAGHQLKERREIATARAAQVIEALLAQGVTARVVGSLATGRFALHSDVDFLVQICPRQLKYSIESDVESIMLDIPFDVLYLNEMPGG